MFLSIRQVKLRLRLFFVIIGLLLLAYFMLAGVLYYDQYQRLTKYYQATMQHHNADIHSLLDLHFEERYKKIQAEVAHFQRLIDTKGGLQIKDNYVKLRVVNEETQVETTAQVTDWRLNELNISSYNNNSFIDSVSKITGCDHTIFQKIPQGMLRLSTTLKGQIGERQLNVFLPNDWELVKTINEGKIYTGRVLLNKKRYIIAYLPLRKGRSIVGMISAILPEYDFGQVTKMLKTKKYLSSGHIYFFTPTGQVILHRDSMAMRMDLKKTTPELLKKANTEKIGSYRYYLALKQIQGWRWQYFSYYPKADFYTAIAVTESEFIDKPLGELRNLLVTSFILFFAIATVVVYFFSNTFTKPISHISKVLNNLAIGKRVQFVPYKQKDEMGAMSVAVGKLIQNNEKSAHFANAIGEGKFEEDFETLGNEDMLGKALLQMRQDLKNSSEKERLHNWITNQNAYFGEVIRKNQQDRNALASQVLLSIMQKLNLVQGAFYEVQAQNNEAVLLSAYAYEREKLLQQKFSLDDGILGEVYQTKQFVEIRELPDGYLKFIAGVGAISPTYLLILPCQSNNEVMAILELANFTPLEDFKIQFLKELAHVIGATLTNIKAAELTLRYLKEAQEASEELLQQDEELRQNMEELAAAHEHSREQEEQIKVILKKSQTREQILKDELHKAQQKIKEMEDAGRQG